MWLDRAQHLHAVSRLLLKDRVARATHGRSHLDIRVERAGCLQTIGAIELGSIVTAIQRVVAKTGHGGQDSYQARIGYCGRGRIHQKDRSWRRWALDALFDDVGVCIIEPGYEAVDIQVVSLVQENWPQSPC